MSVYCAGESSFITTQTRVIPSLWGAAVMGISMIVDINRVRMLRRVAREATGTPLANPFLALAFLPLPVIPEARLTLGGFIHV